MIEQPDLKWIKRWSIVPMLTVDVVGAAVALVVAARSGDGWATVSWMAAFVAVSALPIQLIAFHRLRVGRTSRNLSVLTAVAVVATIATGVGGVAARTIGPLVVALIGLTTTQLNARWYTRLSREVQTELATGSPVPDFEVLDLDGTTVTPASFAGQPVVFVFIRGNWCPLCVAQVRELAADYQLLAAHGVEVALVSPQPLDETRDLAERFDVAFRYLVDPGAAAARQLGILHEGGVPPGVTQLGYEADTVFPTVVVVDGNGTIVFSDQTDDYRIRPEPRLFLEALELPTSTP
jgi:peroxiredoxin